jgi:hypothetical protein
MMGSVPCCARDGSGPPGAAVQAEASNHPLLLHLRDVVVSELGKGRARPCQVRIVESNASEALMKCRKRRNEAKTGRESLTRDQSGRSLLTAQMASGIEAARTRSRLLCGTWEPVTSMLRESHKWKPHECPSTDAGYRGGAIRSSDEDAVMALERRDCPIRLETSVQPVMGGHVWKGWIGGEEEPDERRRSRPVLRAARGEVPRADSTGGLDRRLQAT